MTYTAVLQNVIFRKSKIFDFSNTLKFQTEIQDQSHIDMNNY